MLSGTPGCSHEEKLLLQDAILPPPDMQTSSMDDDDNQGIPRHDDAPHMVQLGYNLVYCVHQLRLSTASSIASFPVSPSPTSSSLSCVAIVVPCSVLWPSYFFIKCSGELDQYINWLLVLKLFVHLHTYLNFSSS